MGVIDFHAHAFPDALAERAVPELAAEGNIAACLDGKISSLLGSMDKAGIHCAVVASIATKPEQFNAILKWSRSIASERLIPFASVHPEDDDVAGRVRAIAAAGLRGIKMHPYYQRFALEEARLARLYEAVQETGLILLMHCGFDIAFPHERICDPGRVAGIAEKYPRLKLVASHLGGWLDWDETERHVIGRPIMLDTSACFDFVEAGRARKMLLAHPAEYLLFGTDSPWFDQAKELGAVKELNLPRPLESAILESNAAGLLGLSSRIRSG
jgi:hypothetical protein